MADYPVAYKRAARVYAARPSNAGTALAPPRLDPKYDFRKFLRDTVPSRTDALRKLYGQPLTPARMLKLLRARFDLPLLLARRMIDEKFIDDYMMGVGPYREPYDVDRDWRDDEPEYVGVTPGRTYHVWADIGVDVQCPSGPFQQGQPYWYPAVSVPCQNQFVGDSAAVAAAGLAGAEQRYADAMAQPEVWANNKIYFFGNITGPTTMQSGRDAVFARWDGLPEPNPPPFGQYGQTSHPVARPMLPDEVVPKLETPLQRYFSHFRARYAGTREEGPTAFHPVDRTPRALADARLLPDIPRHKRNKPGRARKDMKLTTALPKAVDELLNLVTESGEVLQAAYDNLPKKVRDKHFRDLGFRAPTPLEAYRFAWKNMHLVDPLGLLDDLLRNQVEDWVIGKLSKAEAADMQRWWNKYGAAYAHAPTTRGTYAWRKLEKWFQGPFWTVDVAG